METSLTPLLAMKIQSLVDISNLVKSHLASIRLWQCFSGNYFQEQHELQAIAEVLLNVFDTCARFSEVGVAPCSKSL